MEEGVFRGLFQKILEKKYSFMILFMAMGDHFINNTIVNMLHVVTSTGTDELMVVRIAIVQSVSFIIILIWYKNKNLHKQH